MASWTTYEAAALQTRQIAKQAYLSSCKYNAQSSSEQWSDEYYIRAKAAAKANAETFTFPVRVCDKDGANIAHGSCFALYPHQTGILATSRYVADAECTGLLGSHVRVKMKGDWMRCEVLCPDELADRLGKEHKVAVLKLVGDNLAPAGRPLGDFGDWDLFIAGCSQAKGKAAKFHIAQGRCTQWGSIFEFGVTAHCEDSWTGGPVLDAHGHVVEVITGKKGEMTLATTANHLTYYAMTLGLEYADFPGGDRSGEDVVYL